MGTFLVEVLMLSFCCLWSAALADAPVDSFEEEVSEEVIVYADPLAPWDDTRWLVKLQTISREESLAIGADAGVETWMWQVRAVMHCNVVERMSRGGLVACEPEAAGIKVVTDDLWQRERDRDRVMQALVDLESGIVGQEVRLRVKDHGSARILANQDEEPSSDAAATLVRRAFDGFQIELPDEGFRDGVQWVSADEPLLRLRAGMESYGGESVVHVGSFYKGQQLIQTRGQARKRTVVDILRPGKNFHGDRWDASYDPSDDLAIHRNGKEILVHRTLDLDAVAILDRELGYVTERVWHVRGTGVLLERQGRLKLLGSHEEVDLGVSEQCAPIGSKRPHLPVCPGLEAI